MKNYKIDQVITLGGKQWRISAITENFIIVTRVGAPEDTEDYNDIRQVKI